MTLLIIFLSLTNIALGYGWAVYLGHAQAPWATGTSVAHFKLPQMGRKKRDSVDDAAGANDQRRDDKLEDEPAESTEEVATAKADVEVEDMKSPQEVPAPETAVEVEDKPEAEKADVTNTAKPSETKEVAEVENEVHKTSDAMPDVSAEQEVLDNVESLQEELQEQRDSTVEEVISVAEPDTSATESDDDPRASSSPVPQEELLQSISAFKEQLMKQREQSKLHAMSSGSQKKPDESDE